MGHTTSCPFSHWTVIVPVLLCLDCYIFSLYTSASEPMMEEVPKDSKDLPSELSENLEDKVDKDLQSEEVLKTDGHGEPSPPDTNIVSFS